MGGASPICQRVWREELTRTIDPARALAAETLSLERKLKAGLEDTIPSGFEAVCLRANRQSQLSQNRPLVPQIGAIHGPVEGSGYTGLSVSPAPGMVPASGGCIFRTAHCVALTLEQYRPICCENLS